MRLHKLLHHPGGGDPLAILASLLKNLDAGAAETLIIAHNAPLDPLPALWASGVNHFLNLGDPVKAVEFAGLVRKPALAILGERFSTLFSGGPDGGVVVPMEKLFTGSSPEYTELLEDAFPSMLSDSLSRAGVDTASIECVASSLPSLRLARRLPRYLKGAPADSFRYVEEARGLGLGAADMAAYTLGRCLGEGYLRTVFVGLGEWGLLLSLPRWSR